MTKIKAYKEKKSGQTTYWFTHYIGVDGVGKRKFTTKRGFKSFEEAEFALAKLKLSLKGTKIINLNDHTFKEVYDMWWVGYKKNVRPITAERTQQQFQKYILPIFGDKRLKNITIEECQVAVNAWSDNYANYKVLKSCVQRVLDHAVLLRYITDNPMRYIQMPQKNLDLIDGVYIDESNFYNLDELKEFFAILDGNFGIKEKVMFRLLSFTGIRKGELLGLQWGDINFFNHTLTIKKTWSFYEGEEQYSAPKTRKSQRTISLDDSTVCLLEQWKTSQEKELSRIGLKGVTLTHPVFHRFTRNGKIKPLYLDYPNTILSKCLRLKPEQKKITVHGFRHTHASLLIESGASMKEIQERLGHSSIQVTMDVYSHMTESASKETAVRFAKHVNF